MVARASDFSGLRHLRDRLGKRFQSGVVLYTGQRTLSFGDRLAAVLRSVSHAHQVATRLARGGRPYSGSASANVRRALAMLERAGTAEHHGRGDWSIPEPLLRRYLAATL